jgi:hypothetical protein
VRLLFCGGDGSIDRLFLCFVWHICVDGCSSLNVKAFTKILKKFVKVPSTTTSQLAIGSICACFFEVDGLEEGRD